MPPPSTATCLPLPLPAANESAGEVAIAAAAPAVAASRITSRRVSPSSIPRRRIHNLKIGIVTLQMEAAATTPSARPYAGVSATERVDVRRRQLLDAGLALFGSAGYLETGVKDICREAGLTDRYFYESFADKRTFFIAVFDEITGDLFARVAAAVGAVPPDPEPQMQAALGSFLGTLDADPRKARIVFAEAAAAGGEAERHMRTTLRRFSDLVAETRRPHRPPTSTRGCCGCSRSQSSGRSTRW